MAKGEATLLIKITETGKAAFKNIKSGLKSIAGHAKAVTATFVLVGAAIGALAIKAGKFKEIETAFRSMAIQNGKSADMMLSKMKEMSKGTISEMDLMTQANQAMLLGVPVDKFADLLKIARSAAKATGQDIGFMLQSLVTGLGRGSKLILDNAGIVIDTAKSYETYAAAIGTTADKLSDAEKKQAFMNAAIKKGLENVAAAGSGSGGLSITDLWSKAKASIEDASTTIGKDFIPITKSALRWTIELAKWVNRAFTSVTEKDFKTLNKDIVLMEHQLRGLVKVRDKLADQGKDTQAFDTQIANLETEISKHQELIDKKTEGFEKEKEQRIKNLEASQEKDRLDAEALEIRNANEIAAKELHAENLKFINEGMKDSELRIQNEKLTKMLAKEDNVEKIRKLKAEKAALNQKALAIGRQKLRDKETKDKELTEQERINIVKSSLGTIQGLMSSSNKTLFNIGKAAAIANATISTAQGVAGALRLGPPLAFILAPLVAAAGAVQIAKIGATKPPALAEGGIVPATAGGRLVRISEAGKDEAVIPLDDEGARERIGGAGGNITINFTGPILGDETQAREFVLLMDQEMTKLRQDDESLSFEAIS